MAKYFGAGVLLGALVVGACWVGVSFFGPRTTGPQTPQATPGVRFPDGNTSVYFKIKGAMNVAHRDQVTAIDFYPGCIVVHFKGATGHSAQVLFPDHIEDLHWLPSPEKQ